MSAGQGLFRHAEAVMGTVVSYLLEEGDLAFEEVLAATEKSAAELHRLDEIFSLWRPESPMSRYRAGTLGAEELPGEITEVLELCRQVRDETSGFFDPWSLPGGVDPTGLVKGWAVERAAEVLVAAGIPAGIVNGGGDIAAFGEAGSNWRVGIQHPWRKDGLACVVELGAGRALATSGRYERGEHLHDPFGSSEGLRTASASVTGPFLSRADGYATALGVAPDPTALSGSLPPGYETYLIFEDGTEQASDAFPFTDQEAGEDLVREKDATTHS